MCPKILEGHIVRVHLGIVQLQLVLPHLQVMYYGEDFFLMNWLSPLTTIELYALINNGHPTCINNPPMAKSLAVSTSNPSTHKCVLVRVVNSCVTLPSHYFCMLVCKLNESLNGVHIPLLLLLIM
jgi:hypothetical protein